MPNCLLKYQVQMNALSEGSLMLYLPYANKQARARAAYVSSWAVYYSSTGVLVRCNLSHKNLKILRGYGISQCGRCTDGYWQIAPFEWIKQQTTMAIRYAGQGNHSTSYGSWCWNVVHTDDGRTDERTDHNKIYARSSNETVVHIHSAYIALLVYI